MITVQVTNSGAAETRAFLVILSADLGDRRALNEALGLRLAEEIKGHFRAKNAAGKRPGSLADKLGGPKTEFWQRMADATKLETITESGATVAVGTNHFNIHLFGGTILPGPGKKALTIPLIREALGKRAYNYQSETGKKLFTIRGKNALFERTGPETRGSLEPGLIGRVRRRNGTSKSVGLISRTGVRAVFALRKSVTIAKDPDALPNDEALLTALQQEADDYVAALNEGGPA
jgi:hypothetical protein